MWSKKGLFKTIYPPKSNVDGSTHIYSVKVKSQVGNI